MESSSGKTAQPARARMFARFVTGCLLALRMAFFAISFFKSGAVWIAITLSVLTAILVLKSLASLYLTFRGPNTTPHLG